MSTGISLSKLYHIQVRKHEFNRRYGLTGQYLSENVTMSSDSPQSGWTERPELSFVTSRDDREWNRQAIFSNRLVVTSKFIFEKTGSS